MSATRTDQTTKAAAVSADMQYDRPTLPPLYLEKTNKTVSSAAAPASLVQLPNELLSQCLLEYADWGDLSKLACVQSSWKNIVQNAADTSNTSKWQLAQAYLYGDCGLRCEPTKAMKFFRELSRVDMDEHNYVFSPATVPADDDNDDSSSASSNDDRAPHAPSMRKLAEHEFSKLTAPYPVVTGNGDGDSNDEDENDQASEATATANQHHSRLGMAWLQAAYELGGDADAAYELALNYEYGKHHVTVDVIAAYEWFHRAATAGHVDAMAELALCYELGCGVEQDDELALDWYTKAANQGHVTAKFSVGEAFEEARGVPQSDEEACLWYYRAAIVGDEDSKNALKRLYDIARIVVPGVTALLHD